MKLKVYGCKGSAPFFCSSNKKYGGNTSCYRVDVLGNVLILDCGSGLAEFNRELNQSQQKKIKLDILIGHLHLDHIIGLPVFSPLYNKENEIRIFTKSRSNLPLVEQVFGVYNPPYWPISMSEMTVAKMVEINDNSEFSINEKISVRTFTSLHDSGTTAFRINADKSLVYLLDYEIDRDLSKFDALADFCRDADLVIFDTCYMPKDLETKKGWGHSDYFAAVKLFKASGCKKILMSHHAYEYTDDYIRDSYESMEIDTEKFILAYDGFEIEI